MVAVYLASSSSVDGLGLILAICLAGGLAGLLGAKGRRLVIGLLVAVVVAYAATVYAAPYPLPCDPLWKWMGWC